MSADKNRGMVVSQLSTAAHLEDVAAAEGAKYGSMLMRRPASDWHRLMRTDGHYRSYGTLKFLLNAARERFETEPSVAYQLTSAVLRFVNKVEGPSAIATTSLRGLAQKEHANACQGIGDLREALKAAERAITIYGRLPVKFDQALARLVASYVLREMGEQEKALEMARVAASVFDDYGHAAYRTLARMTEGTIFFAQKRFTEALDIFSSLVEHAELAGDKLTLARGLNNAAECARELGDLKAARDLYPRALAHFEELDLPTETTRVRWAHALSLAADGRISYAISELFQVRAIYLSLGMNSHAASAALDIVRFRFDMDEDVRDLCTELVRVFTDAGMTQGAIEALAYLRQQARDGRLTTKMIARVRTYFSELTTRQTLLFVPAREEED
jgi:tetratricopeptide (TPR) repeat protein